jgi:hypothetical protein
MKQVGTKHSWQAVVAAGAGKEPRTPEPATARCTKVMLPLLLQLLLLLMRMETMQALVPLPDCLLHQEAQHVGASDTV